MEINQKNAAGINHGYCENYHEDDKKSIYSKTHYFEGIVVGYCELFDLGGDVFFKCHCIGGVVAIGCYLEVRTQKFYNKTGKLFGEDIAWK